MTIFEAIIQGIIQGATEFLPVSSSGHLSISKHLFGIELPGILFDIMLHLGTLIAVAGTDDVASAYAATYPIALVSVVLASQFLTVLFR